MPNQDEKITLIKPNGGYLNFNNFTELWEFRELLYFLTWRDIKVRYKQTVLGILWAIIQPFLTMVVFSIFLGKLAKVPSDNFPYPIFTYCGLIPWQLFSRALIDSSNSVILNEKLITKVYFPRLIIPLSTILSGFIDFVIALLVVFIIMAYYKIYPTINLFLLPFFILFTVATAMSVGLWLSALNVQYRDVRHILPFLTQLWLFITPIAYPTSIIPKVVRPLYGINPMVGVVEGFRFSLLGKSMKCSPIIFVSILFVILFLAGGLTYFKKMEKTFADII